MARKKVVRPTKEDHRSADSYKENKKIEQEVAKRIAEKGIVIGENGDKIIKIDPPKKFSITDPMELDVWHRGIASRENISEWREIELVYLARYVKLGTILIEAEMKALSTELTYEKQTQFGFNPQAEPIHQVYLRYLQMYLTLGKFLNFQVKVQDEAEMREEIRQQVIRESKEGGVIEATPTNYAEGLLAS